MVLEKQADETVEQEGAATSDVVRPQDDGDRVPGPAALSVAPPDAPSAREAVVDSVIRVPRADVDLYTLRKWKNRLSFPDPRPGHGSLRISAVEEHDDKVCLPRGATKLVRDAGFRLIDRRLMLSPVVFQLRRELRSYQRDACDRALRREQGLILVPTGGGKTLTALAIIAEARQPALVLVPTLDLAKQWADAVRDDLGVEAGVCAGGEITVRDVTIALPKTLSPERLELVRERFGIVIVDEAHHAPAAGVRAILDSMPARYRYGITATPRHDELAHLLEHYVGQVVYKADAATLAEFGYLVRPVREEVATNFQFPYARPSDWPKLLAALVNDPDRNELIASTVRRECAVGAVGLVLTGRVSHADGIVALLRARGVRAYAVVGTMSKAARDSALQRARAGDLDVLVATQLADEGLDIPCLSRLFMTFPARSEGRLTQRIGRVLRPHQDKRDPVVFDFVDPDVGVLAHQARKRAAAFHAVWRAADVPATKEPS